MLPLDGRSLAMMGGAMAALVAGAYVIWGPSEKRRERRGQRVICPGLVNLGNTCFMNAVLQALAPCLSVGQWLTSLSATKRSCGQSLVSTLHNVIKVLNNDSVEFREEYDLKDVLHSLSAHGWVISPEEQDAHEMFHVLTETLVEETTQIPSITSLFDLSCLQEDGVMPRDSARSRAGTDLPTLERGGDAENPFRGLLASQLRCKRCGHKGSLTLEGLLRNYVAPETVDDVTCDRCSRAAAADNSTMQMCKAGSFVKQLTIGKLPRCLCVHVQRTAWLPVGLPVKRFDRVAFPELLAMAPFVYQRPLRPDAPPRPPRPTTLELGGGGGGIIGSKLVGGRRQPNGLCQRSGFKSPPPAPVCCPYSTPVNMLKALHYHTRVSQTGLSSLSPASPPSDLSIVAGQETRQIRRLAQAYSSESEVYSVGGGAYRLTSVVVHLGSASSGHFVTYRRAPSMTGQRFPSQWLYTSDLVVTPASLATVLAADAYMLFYERV